MFFFSTCRLLRKIMATLTEVLDAVTSANTKTDSLIVLVQGLRDQIAQLPTITPEQQVQIDGIFAAVTSEAGKVQAALDANVPPAP